MPSFVGVLAAASSNNSLSLIFIMPPMFSLFYLRLNGEDIGIGASAC